jgi:hypothetical protein
MYKLIKPGLKKALKKISKCIVDITSRVKGVGLQITREHLKVNYIRKGNQRY